MSRTFNHTPMGQCGRFTVYISAILVLVSVTIRLGDNLFAESIVCLNASTGKRVWHFQTVHHGLWDYDLPAAPVLCDITVKGRKIKAVAGVGLALELER